MTAPIIQIENLGKKYQICHSGSRNDGLRHYIEQALRKPFSLFGKAKTNKVEDFWALRGINLKINEGEIVGVIGRNGAGKSTLLKVISRITEPTEGSIRLQGRVASLLEVGTGFHPELSGRENVYLNGVILGMSRSEVSKQFDAIVEFSGVSKFIDTPVKRYSSGMYVRLAFAVAAHLRQEILVVDEVLAVGDQEFQQRCIGKMQDVSAQQGRTVIFVSHNMATLLALCKRGVWLDQGQFKLEGDIQSVVDAYFSVARGFEQAPDWTPSKNLDVAFLSAWLETKDGMRKNVYRFDEDIHLHLSYDIRRKIPGLEITFRIYNANNNIPVFTIDRSRSQSSLSSVGQYHGEICIPQKLLVPGKYRVLLGAHLPNIHLFDVVEKAIIFEIEDSGTGMSHYGNDWGVIMLELPWNENR